MLLGNWLKEGLTSCGCTVAAALAESGTLRFSMFLIHCLELLGGESCANSWPCINHGGRLSIRRLSARHCRC